MKVLMMTTMIDGDLYLLAAAAMNLVTVNLEPRMKLPPTMGTMEREKAAAARPVRRWRR